MWKSFVFLIHFTQTSHRTVGTVPELRRFSDSLGLIAAHINISLNTPTSERPSETGTQHVLRLTVRLSDQSSSVLSQQTHSCLHPACLQALQSLCSTSLLSQHLCLEHTSGNEKQKHRKTNRLYEDDLKDRFKECIPLLI